MQWKIEAILTFKAMAIDIRENFSNPNRDQKDEEGAKKKYISVYWKCCNTFSRVYKSRDGSAYAGHCPRCRSHLSVPVGPGGTSQRTFVAE